MDLHGLRTALVEEWNAILFSFFMNMTRSTRTRGTCLGHLSWTRGEGSTMFPKQTKGTDPANSASEMAEEVLTEASDRPRWNSRLEYILSLLGYCVGLGNLWRFPYICNRNGGGAFLLPFALCVMIFGFPLFFLEVSLSQFSGRGNPRVWSFCPMFKGVGVGSMLLYPVFLPYYSILLALSFYYMVQSCSSVLPWTTCSNSWNSGMCIEDVKTSSNLTPAVDVANTSTVADAWQNVTLSHTAAEEFWQYSVLNISSGLEEVGSVQWHLVGCLFAAYVLMFLCMIGGIKSVGKAVYVTALLPYILLVTIFIRMLMLPGAGAGLMHFVTPDFSELLHAQVWIEALLQVMYELALGWGAIGAASSYNKFHESCLTDAIIVCAVSEGTSIFAGFVTFATLGVMSEKTGVPVSEVVSSGTGLGFVLYPEALVHLPFPQVWSFIFFLMMLTIGLDSQFLNVEAIVTALVDRLPATLSRRRRIVTAAVCVVSFLVGIIYCTQGGQYLLQLVDWYIGAFYVFVFCTVECVSIVWIYGVNQISKDVEMMTGRHLPVYIKIMWGFVIPGILSIVFVLTLLWYQPPTYGKYSYPSYASTVGWFIAAVALIPVPFYMIQAVRKHITAHTFTKSVKLALKPDDEWCPSDPLYREEYRRNLVESKSSLRDNIKNVFRK
ncbi:sodium- and chloride-dependent glycine transporter 1-like [Haliotis asinina]|uniref:sodium- and chloride-dependent glycine transporter 1-like n=1 Tax=Haliotis asinina TaxID=109174 RepID=UPI00353238B5